VIKENHKKFPQKPSLQVELGNFMQGTGPDRTVKNKWMWEGMSLLGIQVLNVGEDDIAELIALGVDYKNSDRLISANLLSKETGEPLLKPYVIKLISLPGTEKKLRLGFLGLSGRDSYLKTDAAGYVWADPQNTAKKWLPELREKCDFLIVLACMPASDAVQLAVNNSNIDIIVTGFKHQASGPPANIGKSTFVYAEDEGRILGELRFIVPRGENLQVKPLNHVLTRNVKDDPDMAAFISKAKTEISAAQNEIAKGNKLNPTQVEATVSTFITSQNCAACHRAEFDVWAKSGHAHAINILKRERKEFDTSCVICHVTGAGKPGGFTNLYQTPQMANVQCEACHGPGREHSLRPTEAKMPKLGSGDCLVCHTKSNSPEFEFASYWQKIKH
jgi:2',3'-cyclic-nucleotide 2'-phosphodiesterase (5'-nucleotidase family)